jgi:HAMP domain-containing protein
MKRRLLILSVLLVLFFVLLADYLVFLETKSSRLSGLWTFLSTVSALLGKAFWLPSYLSEKTLLLIGLLLFGIIIIGLALRRAKRAKRFVTEDVDEAGDKMSVNPAPTEAPLAPLIRVTGYMGMTGKMILSLTAITTLFGLATMAVVYSSSFELFENSVNERFSVLATSIGNATVKYIQEKNIPGLHDELMKHAVREQIAYILVKDINGNVAVQTSDKLPTRPEGDTTDIWAPTPWRLMRYEGSSVYDIRVPISDGQLGVLHLGVWQAAVEKEVWDSFSPIMLSIVILWVITVAALLLAARWISRPLARLAAIASRVSKGELESPIGMTTARGDIGELARALERMRASLKAVMTRLQQE